MNPDKLRINDKALAIVKTFVESGKVVAAICHAPWLLIEAGAVKGREVTSYISIRTDVVNAGGRWVDKTCRRRTRASSPRATPATSTPLSPRSSRRSRRGCTGAPPEDARAAPPRSGR